MTVKRPRQMTRTSSNSSLSADYASALRTTSGPRLQQRIHQPLFPTPVSEAKSAGLRSRNQPLDSENHKATQRAILADQYSYQQYCHPFVDAIEMKFIEYGASATISPDGGFVFDAMASGPFMSSISSWSSSRSSIEKGSTFVAQSNQPFASEARSDEHCSSSTIVNQRYSLHHSNQWIFLGCDDQDVYDPPLDATCPPPCSAQSGFLNACNYCKKRLDPDRNDIFIYRGDKAFCSSQCRQHQIRIDEKVSIRSKPSRRFSMVPSLENDLATCHSGTRAQYHPLLAETAAA